MTDFRKTYKQVGLGLQNLLVNQRALRREYLKDQRRSRRSELFSASRDNPQGNPQGPLKEQLEAKKLDGDCTSRGTNHLQTHTKWREERNQRKLLEKIRAKPPFKVGIVHHRWYSPSIIKDIKMKNTQKREITRNKKTKVIKKGLQALVGHQFKAQVGFNAVSPFDRRVAKKRVQTKNDLQNVLDDSLIKFLPENSEGISPEEQEEEGRTAQYYMYLLNQETERLIGLCDSLEPTKNEESTGDLYHLIEECHARFKILEELEN